jgi:hypothetical protein
VYGRPPARFGQGELARVEMFVNEEKEGKLQRVYLEGNLNPNLPAPACGIRPLPPPPPK